MEKLFSTTYHTSYEESSNLSVALIRGLSPDPIHAFLSHIGADVCTCAQRKQRLGQSAESARHSPLTVVGDA